MARAAARAMAKDADKILLDVDGEKRPGAVYRTLTASEVKATPLKVANDGDGPVQAVVSVSGAPLIPEPAAEQGFKIERKFYSLDGKETDPSQAKQDQRFVVVLRMTEPIPQYGRIVVADNLPAGFEIDNPKLVSSGDTGTLSWIQDAVAPISSTFKDDRFVAAFDRKANDRPVFTVAYVVRAVTRGHFVLPQAKVEDMYPPDATAAPRRARLRSRTGHDAPRITSVLRAAAGASCVVVVAALTLTVWFVWAGPPPSVKSVAYGTVVLDHEGRLLRPYTAADGAGVSDAVGRCRSALCAHVACL